jgi:glycosyltransferase involved in cell wall biosynthesis
MRVSVIVCTYNRAKSIVKCLDSIAVSLTTASPLAAEIVVVDNASTDETTVVVGSWADTTTWPVRVVTETNRGLSCARNCGIRASQGQLFVFTDDDCCLHPDYIKELLYYDDQDLDVVLRGGLVELGNPADLPITIITLPTLTRWCRSANSARHMNLGDTLIGCNLAMRREVAEIVGPFDVRLGAGSRIPGGEDTDFIFRAYLAGVRLEYVPNLVVYHYHGRRAVADGKKLFQNYAMGGGALFAKYAVRAPGLCRPIVWDVKNAIREVRCGSNLFMPSLGISHKDKLKWYTVGAVRFVMAATIDVVRQMVPYRG